MSAKSARRLIRQILDAPKDWAVMVTLTFQDRVIDGRPALEKFEAQLRAWGLDELQWLWVREYQARGAVHYHWLWERDGLEARGYLAAEHLRQVRRKGKLRTVVGGQLERMICAAWLEAIGDNSDKAHRFNMGGIIELLETANGAAHYFGSYLTKPEQKNLPPGAAGCGRWWCAGKMCKPLPGEHKFITDWPFPKVWSVVFDKAKLAPYISATKTTGEMPQQPTQTNDQIQRRREQRQQRQPDKRHNNVLKLERVQGKLIR